jgi:uncharacterized protein YycO
MDLDSKILKPGDCLLYRASGFFGHLISLKTWSHFSHVEVYIGNNKSVASRDGIGVNEYTLRLENLGFILRPNRDFNIKKALKWFHDIAKGQRYDWKGILVFTLAAKQGSLDRMFCSEFATRFYRNGDFNPFNINYNADRIAPSNFLISPNFDEIWKDLDL